MEAPRLVFADFRALYPLPVLAVTGLVVPHNWGEGARIGLQGWHHGAPPRRAMLDCGAGYSFLLRPGRFGPGSVRLECRHPTVVDQCWAVQVCGTD